MKPTKSILILLSLFLTFSFSEDLRVEIIKRYDNGNKKLLVKYKGDDGEEVLVEKINYSESGDTLIWENYDSKGERDGNWIGYVNDFFVKGMVFTYPSTKELSTYPIQLPSFLPLLS